MQDQNKHITLIFKHLSGDTNKAEEKQLFDWIKERNENKTIFSEYQKVWAVSDTSLNPEIDAINLDEEWNKFKNEVGFDDKLLIPKQKTKKKFSVYRVAAAVSVILLIGVAALYILNPRQEVIYAQNEVLESKLPDGTEITVNKNSSITYSKKFNKKERKVELAGDAYFKVEKDKTKPFIIDAESFYVEVLGTEFYVNSIFKERQVVVTEGSVAVYQFKDKRDQVILTAGEEIIFDTKQNEIRKIESYDENYLSWKTKIFHFNNKKLEDIFTELEAVYDVKFEFKNPELKKCRQSVSFADQSIDEILNVLRATFDQISFNRNKNMIFIDGDTCNSL